MASLGGLRFRVRTHAHALPLSIRSQGCEFLFSLCISSLCCSRPSRHRVAPAPRAHRPPHSRRPFQNGFPPPPFLSLLFPFTSWPLGPVIRESVRGGQCWRPLGMWLRAARLESLTQKCSGRAMEWAGPCREARVSPSTEVSVTLPVQHLAES